MAIKTATEFQIEPLPDAQKVILSFLTPPDHTQVELSVPVTTDMMRAMVYCLVTNPNEEARRLPAQLLTVREIAAGLVNGMPVLSYELELGVTATTTIELSDAKRLRDELTAVIDAAAQASKLAH
ncbi:MAG: hypothetical protein EOO23_00315 [Comamonadaceae bacterium]|nr:MAG: hypothetical protein EOO23_00315 [Comamonadaceae bacterium]